MSDKRWIRSYLTLFSSLSGKTCKITMVCFHTFAGHFLNLKLLILVVDMWWAETWPFRLLLTATQVVEALNGVSEVAHLLLPSCGRALWRPSRTSRRTSGRPGSGSKAKWTSQFKSSCKTEIKKYVQYNLFLHNLVFVYKNCNPNSLRVKLKECGLFLQNIIWISAYFPILMSILGDWSKSTFLLFQGRLCKTLPLELKTGRPSGSAEHRGQVIIYR